MLVDAGGVRSAPRAHERGHNEAHRLHDQADYDRRRPAAVQQGKLSLDGAAAALIPELGALKVLQGWDAKGAPRVAPRHVTPGHLYVRLRLRVLERAHGKLLQHAERSQHSGGADCGAERAAAIGSAQ